MRAFLTSLWNGVRSAVGLILPAFGHARGVRRLGPEVRWALQAVLVLAVLVGLYFVNRLSGLKGIVVSRYGLLREGWLPIFFLLFYALGWLGWWLWKLFQVEEEASAFPDIDDAWAEALKALGQARIDLTEVPLFLVLGQPAHGEESLMQAARLKLDVQGAPRRPDAPLHVYANQEGIYLTCTGASLMGRQAALLAEEGVAAGAGGEPGGAPFDPTKTFTAGSAPVAVRDMKAILALPDLEKREQTEEERQVLRRIERADRVRPDLLADRKQAELLTARLEHLCRLVVRDRRPYAPLNGILLLLPYAAADSDRDANQTGDVWRRDLSAARGVFQLYCPLLALVCDMEKAPGFREFVRSFPPDQRQRRLGQRFPHVPDVPRGAAAEMITNGIAWVCNSLFPTWVYERFRLEAPGAEDLAGAVRGNSRLCQLLGEMRARQARFSRILTRGLPLEEDGPVLLGGCYLAATGADPANEQAFVPGVFNRLVEDQEVVSWTEEARQEEEACQHWAVHGYTLLAVVALAVLAGVVFSFWGGGRKTPPPARPRPAALAARGFASAPTAAPPAKPQAAVASRALP
jgi:hypothetical protein